jgi:phenylacetic acid degradation operon negative regulatory protein
VTTKPDEAEERGPKPRSLIVTFFGTYGRDVGGWVSVADLVRLMAELGVDGPAVRSAVSRLKRRGLLEAQRMGGTAGYTLSEHAQRILAEGDRRIFGRRVASLSDEWVVVVFSVPESERHKRHQLRTALTWLGFGTIAPGTWIAPAHLTEDVRRTFERLELSEHVDLFHSEHVGFRDPREAVATWWDLDELQALYDEFLGTHEPVLTRWNRRRTLPPAEAFADHLRTVDAWRRMPYLDPGLPTELLPAGWSGSHAANVFFALHARLREPGMQHVRDVTGG